ncbi:DNA primase small subunit domain-containing protein [Methanofollis fontis]|uniref:DNA primase small subunit PriS n=1 Tax=Methanofollis fontis TaxID=2052832 RepID=A0A483CQC0_9EURY|nr:DNA primase small subunit PriS [Methanofollis fontis]TAJ44885.1 DNA primase catalytic subunit PriS [Methanofollis fontis]
MKPATLEFVRQRFGSYYHQGHLAVPPALQQREWGFIFFDAHPAVRMRRHLGFTDREECLSYVRSMVPAHAYYSTAHYTNPGAATMGEKGWSGADLIFDIDADHLFTDLKGITYDLMLARAKDETEKLLSMLTEELGFSRRTITLVFSGGRGYHVHVRDNRVLAWGSGERREVVDYVCGTGIEPQYLLSAGHGGGWQKRFVSAMEEYAASLMEGGEAAARKKLCSLEGVGKTYADRFLSALMAADTDFRRGEVPQAVLASPAMRALLSHDGGEVFTLLKAKGAAVDEPVSTDIKRLIRMPTSLHGGSGLRVVEIPLKEFSAFDPLIDAVVFGDRTIKVDAAFNLTVPMLGNTYDLKKGANTVPEALAVYLCCRGIGEIGGGA